MQKTMDHGSASPEATSSLSLNDNRVVVSETVLVKDQITNNGNHVQLSRIDYSEGMRAYRLYRISQLGTVLDHGPFLHIFGASDILLLCIGALFSLFFMPSFFGSPYWMLEKSENDRDFTVKSRLQLGAVIICFLLLFFRLYRSIKRVYIEEILAIRGVGVQIVSYGVFKNVKHSRFIDWKMIRSLVIHDTYYRYRPIFFLSSSIENEPERFVYFESFLPRLEVLQPVLCGLKHILFGEEEFGPSLADIEAEELVDPAVVEDSGGDDSTLLNGSELGSSIISD